eukprot:1143069-Pelagomonas_calceolata.AAC.1
MLRDPDHGDPSQKLPKISISSILAEFHHESKDEKLSPCGASRKVNFLKTSPKAMKFAVLVASSIRMGSKRVQEEVKPVEALK